MPTASLAKRLYMNTSGEDFEDSRKPGGAPEALLADYIRRYLRGEIMLEDEVAARAGPRADELRRSIQQFHALESAHGNLLKQLFAETRGESASEAASSWKRKYAGPIPEHITKLLERLSKRTAGSNRYTLKGELGHGGMGAVLRAYDEDLQRHLALKVILGKEHPESSGGTPGVHSQYLTRFLDEANVTGQLDHPGIVPVHELGVDAGGNVYFTMKLVKGDTFKDILAGKSTQTGAWSLLRKLRVLVRVCEAMSYAHSKDVIHRDLKPANIMVGRFDEVYVMDWGIAKVLGMEDNRDIRIREEQLTSSLVQPVLKRKNVDGDDGDPLVTMDGQAIGTPAYMPPEQALGHIEDVHKTSDIYSIGAILYHLLTGTPPHVEPGEKPGNYVVLRRVQKGPAAAVHKIAPDASPELAAICNKAMATYQNDRFQSVEALKNELLNYVDGRVVKTYERGALAELRKWILRNKLFASAAAAAGLLIIFGSILFAWEENRRAGAQELEIDARRAAQFVADAPSIWPSTKERMETARRWIEEVKSLLLKRNHYETILESLLTLTTNTDKFLPGNPRSHGGFVNDEQRLDAFVNRLDGFKKRTRERAAWEPDLMGLDSETEHLGVVVDLLRQKIQLQTRWRRAHEAHAEKDQLGVQLLEAFERLDAPGLGLLNEVEKRYAIARTYESRDGWRAQACPSWEDAIRSIQNINECPDYNGYIIKPQFGLVPLRRNPDSKLWEFWLPLTGAKPAELPKGNYSIDAESAVVLVLIPAAPGDKPWMGMNYIESDPDSVQAAPPHGVALEPYFISKYEMTQGQWERLTGGIPNKTFAGTHFVGIKFMITRAGPVENVSWDDCYHTLGLVDLRIPTEAQWEWAARGKSASEYWWGGDPLKANDNCNWIHGGNLTVPMAANKMEANPYGLYHISGNIKEWCYDFYELASNNVPVYDAKTCEISTNGDGEHLWKTKHTKAVRGGSFKLADTDLRGTGVLRLRVAYRNHRAPYSGDEDLGVRPARAVEK